MTDDIQLPTVCSRLLNDKLFEKKKLACREIEIMTKDFNAAGRHTHIKKLIDYFINNFISSSQASSKVGGLVALSSVAIALDRDAKHYLAEIIKPIFNCTYDCQRDVRYRALESLYNVAKCVRGDVLIYLDEIFDIIIRFGEDVDTSIREASLLMDKLVKDIVIENPCFNIVSFIEVIRERIYALTANTRKMILSWISFLDSVPDIDLLLFIRDILDGLLKIACDSNLEIRRTAEVILAELFSKIENNSDNIEFKPLIKILLIHVQTDSQLVQNISLKWITQCIKLGNEMDILHNSAHIIAVILPCLSYTRIENDEHEKSDNQNFQKENIEIAKSINESMLNLVTNFKYNEPTSQVMKKEESVIFEKLPNNENSEQFNISKILIVLLNELELGSKTSSQTKIAILEWIYQIYTNLNIDVDEHLESRLVQILLHTLHDASDSVVLMDLKVLGCIIFKGSSEETELQNYRKLINPLIDLFFKSNHILKERGSFIICQLCSCMNATKVYTTFSESLLDYDRKFVCSMVYILNTILLTSKELAPIRNDLKMMISSGESTQLFHCLYKTWCYSPVSVISLCFLTKCYRLSSELILHFGSLNITIDILLEIDQLIQMLESPIFTSLRLDLLDSTNSYLRKSLYGLLMLLPQSEAFHLLRKRLRCVPSLPSDPSSEIITGQPRNDKDFSHLLAYYIETQKSLDTQSPNQA